MLTDEDIRLECLRIAERYTNQFDITEDALGSELIICAKSIYDFVKGDKQPVVPPFVA